MTPERKEYLLQRTNDAISAVQDVWYFCLVQPKNKDNVAELEYLCKVLYDVHNFLKMVEIRLNKL